MNVLAIVVGSVLVLSVLADMINTLVTTNTSTWRWWLTRVLYRRAWFTVAFFGRRIDNPDRRERLYSLFAPVSVLAMLGAWVTQQIIGFGLIWWGLRAGIDGDSSLLDSLYFSGVVFFTVGFGEVVPVDQVPRFGALIEAFTGVLTTALVIGYLPALYAAYSEREQKLLTLDDGGEDRITPTNLVIARCPDGDIRSLDGFFESWEAWIAQVLETHTTFPMLRLFRSQYHGQSWITALGLIADAALHAELTVDGKGRASYWTLRRASRLMQMLTEGIDLTEYRERLDNTYVDPQQMRDLYALLEEHGFELLPWDEALEHSRALRRTYDAQLEWLIDAFDAPRGFWGHEIGHELEAEHVRLPGERWPTTS